MTAIIQGRDPIPADWRYEHEQMTPASIWTVTHNLGGFPSVTVVDSTGREVVGGTEYLDSNTVRLLFSAPFSGHAYFS